MLSYSGSKNCKSPKDQASAIILNMLIGIVAVWRVCAPLARCEDDMQMQYLGQ